MGTRGHLGSLPIVGLAACLLLAQSGATQSGRVPAGPAHLDLDELIERLPTVDDEQVGLYGPGRNEARTASDEFSNRLDQGVELTGEQWLRALVRTGALRMRNRWPTAVPYAISMQEPQWLFGIQVRMVPRRVQLTSASLGFLGNMGRGCLMGPEEAGWPYQELGLLPVGSHHLRFKVTIERGELRFTDYGFGPSPVPPPRPSAVLWKGEWAFDVKVVDSVDKAIQPVSSVEFDAAVKSWLSLVFTDWYDGPTALLMLCPTTSDKTLTRLGLSLHVEILEAGVVRGEAWLLTDTYDPTAGLYPPLEINKFHRWANAPIRCIPLELQCQPSAQQNWWLLVRGTSTDVTHLWNIKHRWDGELLLPLAELIRK